MTSLFCNKRLSKSRREFLHRLVFASLLIVLTLVFIILIRRTSRQSDSRTPLFPLYDEDWTTCLEHSLVHPGTPTVFAITPTQSGPTQLADLIGLEQAFRSVPHLHWIVAEDSQNCSQLILDFFERWPDLSYTLLASPTPEIYKLPDTLENFDYPAGISGRRAALRHLLGWKTRAKIFVNSRNDVVYFADAGYVYDPRLFEAIRDVTVAGMFPVGLTQPLGISSPVVGTDGRVIGFLSDAETSNGRRFPTPLTGFAVGLSAVRKARPQMAYRASWEGESFLRSLGIKYESIEPLAQNCTEIYVWKVGDSGTTSTRKRLNLQTSTVNYVNVDKLLLSLETLGVVESSNGSSGEVQDIYICLENQCESVK